MTAEHAKQRGRNGPAVRNEALPSCSFFCEMAEQEYAA
jgi:hypothetical protein